jgi:hypothetical protein
LTEVKDAPLSDLPCRIENQIFDLTEPGSARRREVEMHVGMALTGERSAVGQLQIALRPFQGLDRRLFVNADDDRVLGRRQIEPDDVNGYVLAVRGL